MAYSICKVKNISGAVNTLHGHEFQVDDIYDIKDSVRQSWASSDDVLTALSSETHEVHNSVGVIEGLSNQINHLHDHSPIEVAELEPFAKPTFRTKRNATTSIVSCALNTSTVIDFDLTEERYVAGGMLLIENYEFGDYVTAEVNDKNGVIPEAYRAALCEAHPTVAKYIEKEWVSGANHSISTMPLNAKITAGLCLRVTYHATNSGSARNVLINYDLTKKL